MLPQANIQQIVALAGAFKRYADYPFGHRYRNFSEAMEAVAGQIQNRGNKLLPHANAEQIATLAGAFMSHPEIESYADNIQAFAWQVKKRGDALLRGAGAKQLATLKAAFDDIDEPDCRSALAKVVETTAKRDAATFLLSDTQPRPQLDKRDRSGRR